MIIVPIITTFFTYDGKCSVVLSVYAHASKAFDAFLKLLYLNVIYL